MNVETIHDDWIHKWFNLFDGGLGYFWCGCLAMVAVVLGFVWCWPNIQKLQSKADD
ncbi:hypothetical protein [Acetobacter malorum]|uniref:hypothetical protein n=1 Tax=Acetobacter malorum TaxID=178901 RepID=UPI000AB9B7BC|nr:hypothetical protein [Acetobacter malorum]